MHDLINAALRKLPPEAAHNAVLWALARGYGPTRRGPDDPALRTHVWGLEFANPIGMAAGFDKNGVAIAGILKMGFGFHELGGVTPQPQTGNRRPRLFRLARDRALINRMGFNNDGLDVVADRLAAYRDRAAAGPLPRPVVGVNLAANTDSEKPIDDFVRLTVRLNHLADFLTVDISCPNTANGQLFLQPRPFGELLAALNGVDRSRDNATRHHTPRLVKLSPDLDDDRLKTLIGIALEAGIDGLIVANTSTARPNGLASKHRDQPGGLSGPPIFATSTRMLHRTYRETEGRIPLIGVGGIASGRDAYAKIRAGASLVQLYTGLVYEGPGLLARIKSELVELAAADGFGRLADAVGADHR